MKGLELHIYPEDAKMVEAALLAASVAAGKAPYKNASAKSYRLFEYAEVIREQRGE